MTTGIGIQFEFIVHILLGGIFIGKQGLPLRRCRPVCAIYQQGDFFQIHGFGKRRTIGLLQ